MPRGADHQSLASVRQAPCAACVGVEHRPEDQEHRTHAADTAAGQLAGVGMTELVQDLRDRDGQDGCDDAGWTEEVGHA